MQQQHLIGHHQQHQLAPPAQQQQAQHRRDVSKVPARPRVTLPPTGKSLFVSKLHRSIDFTRLHQLFSPYGKVLCARVLYNAVSGDSRGIGFVNFETVEGASAAMAALNGKPPIPDAAPMQIKLADGDASFVPEESTKLFVRNIPIGTPPEKVSELFKTFGTVRDIAVQRDVSSKAVHDGIEGLMAYVTYETADQAVQAAAATDRHDCFSHPSGLTLIVKPSETQSTRDERINRIRQAHSTAALSAQMSPAQVAAAANGLFELDPHSVHHHQHPHLQAYHPLAAHSGEAVHQHAPMHEPQSPTTIAAQHDLIEQSNPSPATAESAAAATTAGVPTATASLVTTPTALLAASTAQPQQAFFPSGQGMVAAGGGVLQLPATAAPYYSSVQHPSSHMAATAAAMAPGYWPVPHMMMTAAAPYPYAGPIMPYPAAAAHHQHAPSSSSSSSHLVHSASGSPPYPGGSPSFMMMMPQQQQQQHMMSFPTPFFGMPAPPPHHHQASPFIGMVPLLPPHQHQQQPLHHGTPYAPPPAQQQHQMHHAHQFQQQQAAAFYPPGVFQYLSSPTAGGPPSSSPQHSYFFVQAGSAPTADVVPTEQQHQRSTTQVKAA